MPFPYGDRDISSTVDPMQPLYDRLDKVEKQIDEIHAFCQELSVLMANMNKMGPVDVMKMFMGGGGK